MDFFLIMIIDECGTNLLGRYSHGQPDHCGHAAFFNVLAQAELACVCLPVLGFTSPSHCVATCYFVMYAFLAH